MIQYHDLVRGILDHGIIRDDRTGIGTRSVFGRQLRFDLRAGFPLLTTRKIHWRSIVGELLWMLRGDSNVRSLQRDGITIWDEWADENGDLGPVYGVQWRHWGGDQLKRVINEIRTNPTSRRLIVSAWNAAEIDRMALPPCHALFQFYVNLSSTNSNPTPAGQERNQTEGYLDCHLYQRSSDVFLGLPFNIASYALLTHMVAHVCGLSAGDLIISIGDAHLYSNHEEQARLLLTRDHLPAPTLRLNPDLWRSQIDRFTADDIIIENYQHHPAIKAPVAV